MPQEVKIIVFGGLATLALTLVGVYLLTRTAPSGIPGSGSAVLVRDTSYRSASASATLTLVEFGDFECPACGAVFPTVEKIRADYAGQLAFVFRQFPLSQHANARPAALAAESAGSQGKFWEMYDLLYQNQSQWSASANPLDIFKQYAASLGLDIAKFTQDLSSGELSSRVNADIKDGNDLGVDATPTFFLNGEKLTSIYDYAGFKSAIESHLPAK